MTFKILSVNYISSKTKMMRLLLSIAFVALMCATNVAGASSVKIEARLIDHPLMVGKSSTEMLKIAVVGKGQTMNSVQIPMLPKESATVIQSAQIFVVGTKGSSRRDLVATGIVKNGGIAFNTSINLTRDTTWLSVEMTPTADANIETTFHVGNITTKMADKSVVTTTIENGKKKVRLAYLLRAAGEDHCHTYRIPGMTTTNKGTLITVFDNRYDNSKDLQGRIKIGMNRSTDGGQTWEPMKVIMDMKNWGGLHESLNGVTDPSVLFDTKTNTIWVAAMWLHGGSKDQMAWWASKPGMNPGETGQFMLVKSTDDGLTWSEPINITSQIKDPKWQLLLQGPGRGITMTDGTIVFPAQFKEDIGEKAIDGGQYTPFSTLIWSKDGGETWTIGSGAKPNTTEAQVVQLSDGSLMLNMRDDLNRREKGDNNGRAVAITKDLGMTWTLHHTSNHVLQESNCMASLLAFDTNVNGKKQKVLFFSNPNDKYNRSNMTIKMSLDEGETWPEEYTLHLNQDYGFGYSCLSPIDDNTIGIIYEGSHNLIFQKVKISDILNAANH